jgi:hypothetical protein
VIDSVFADTADAAIHVLDSNGLLIARNRISVAGNNGIQVWRSMEGDDGSMVVDNRIDKVANRAGGSGQYGNGINVFRAANVLVRGNRINSCAFSAVRGTLRTCMSRATVSWMQGKPRSMPNSPEGARANNSTDARDRSHHHHRRRLPAVVKATSSAPLAGRAD